MYVVSIKSKPSTQLPITIPRSHSPSESYLQSNFATGLSCKSLIEVSTVLYAYKLVLMWPTAVAARQGSLEATPRMPKPPLSSLVADLVHLASCMQPSQQANFHTTPKGFMRAAPDLTLLVTCESYCRCCWTLEQGRGSSLWQQQPGAIGQLPLSCLLTVWRQWRPASPSTASKMCSPCTR